MGPDQKLVARAFKNRESFCRETWPLLYPNQLILRTAFSQQYYLKKNIRNYICCPGKYSKSPHYSFSFDDWEDIIGLAPWHRAQVIIHFCRLGPSGQLRLLGKHFFDHIDFGKDREGVFVKEDRWFSINKKIAENGGGLL